MLWTVIVCSTFVVGASFRPLERAPRDLHQSAEPEPVQRLPRTVRVKEYALSLRPYFPYPGFKYPKEKHLTFEGETTILFTALRDTRAVSLLADRLHVERANLSAPRVKDHVTIDAILMDEERGWLNVSAVPFFKKGREYRLHIVYSGAIGDHFGLYHSDYHELDERGRTGPRTMVATTLEPYGARRVFPSFDDPYLKAAFRLRLIHPAGADVYHNIDDLERTSTRLDKYSVMTDFMITPRMSTYLFAFAIGEFVSEETKTKRGVIVRSITIPEMRDYLNVSAKIGAQCLDSMEELVKVKYPLDKLDNLEMLTMNAGAMENWGLIIYNRFLSQHPHSPAAARYGQKSVICHEIAHQWFGNLVTADYWGQLFLHESFASYFQHRSYSDFEDHQISLVSAISDRTGGLASAYHAKHALVADEPIFDVTYKAGGAILRQTEAAMGTDKFLLGLQHYLVKHQYASATHEDLLTELEAAAGGPLCANITLSAYLRPYLLQPSHPVVSVWLDEAGFHLRQWAPQTGAKWLVPIEVRDLRTNRTQLAWLDRADQLRCATLAPDGLYAFNVDGRTFARFLYDRNYLRKLLAFGVASLSPGTQAALVDDFFWALSEKRSDLDREYVQLLTALSRARPVSPYVGATIVSGYLTWSELLRGTHEHDLVTVGGRGWWRRKVQSRLGPLLLNMYEKALWWDESVSRGIYSGKLLVQLVEDDLGDARHTALQLFDAFHKSCDTLDDLQHCNTLAADVRPAVYCAGAKSKDPFRYKFLKAYQKAHARVADTLFYFSFEVEAIASGLACAGWRVNDVIDTAIELNQTDLVISELQQKSYGISSIANYVKERTLNQTLDPDLYSSALNVIHNDTSEADLDVIHDLDKFLQDKLDTKKLSRWQDIVKDAKERIQANKEDNERKRLRVSDFIS